MTESAVAVPAARGSAVSGKPLRIAVVAAGSHIFQAAHVPALAAIGAEVVGVFDAAPGRAAAVGAAHGWPVADDLDDLLRRDADAVVVCAPHPLHREIVLRCLAAGRAVLVEKPIAPRVGEADEMAAAAAAAGRPVAVVHQHRLRDEVVAAHRLIREGGIGRIHRAVVVASYPKRSVYYTDTPWRGTWAGEGGGVLLNQGLHDIDVLVHLVGSPHRLAATMHTHVHPIQTEDTADLLLEWADGATGSVHITSAAALGRNRLEIHGSAGSLRLTAAGLEVRRAGNDFDEFAAAPGGHFDAFDVSDWRLDVPAGHGTHTDVYADFARAVAGMDEPAVSVSSARAAVEVIAAASVAAAEGRWVALPLDSAVHDAFLDAAIAAATEHPTEREVAR